VVNVIWFIFVKNHMNMGLVITGKSPEIQENHSRKYLKTNNPVLK